MRLKYFSVCGHSCGQSGFSAQFDRRGKSRKRRRCKAFRRFDIHRPGYSHGTPKSSAIPTSLHPVVSGLRRSACAAWGLYVNLLIPLQHKTRANGSRQCPMAALRHFQYSTNCQNPYHVRSPPDQFRQKDGRPTGRPDYYIRSFSILQTLIPAAVTANKYQNMHITRG